ncbi:MAG TPA: cobyric acid synthase [Candidatus Angelobacter sp.]|nr:cobyric acid synthase [Candidatus Angelobacter sp.]
MSGSRAPVLMVQGTTSSAGKSLLVTALCRIFRQAGISVAPFKAQNMALNSAVTCDGLEIGRAQAVQAEAAEIEPSVDMNPILLKPEGDRRSQVVVLGKVLASMAAREYHEHKPELRTVVADALDRLRRKYQLVIIEGAGSPAEINLKERDLVNMFVARLVNAPVLLAGDIDRGGVFASFVGTMELLEPEERALVRGFVVNNFRGDRALLEPGLDFLSRRTGVPVVGVIPHIPNLQIAEEDSLALQWRTRKAPAPDTVDIAVVCFPRISNYDDFQPLEHLPGVSLRFVTTPDEVCDADLLILPGSKSTISDLAWLRSTGFEELIRARASNGRPVMGMCGGCQMLGQAIEDPEAIESPTPYADGLKLLDLKTRFSANKMTAQVTFRTRLSGFWGMSGEQDLHGYEIHMGMIEQTAGTAPFEIVIRNGMPARISDGAVNESGSVMGTMIHGFFTNQPLREALIRSLQRRKGLPEQALIAPMNKVMEYDRLAGFVRAGLDLPFISQLTSISASQLKPESSEVQTA